MEWRSAVRLSIGTPFYLLALCLVLSTLAPDSLALTVSFRDTLGSPGTDSLLTAVEVDDATGIAGAELTVTYDSTAFVARKASTTELTSGFTLVENLSTAGKITIAMASPDSITSGRGALVSLLFSIKVDAVPGVYPVVLSGVALRDHQLALMPVDSISSGSIRVISSPEAAFSGEPLAGTEPLVVTFRDLSTGAPTSWLWDFGDGDSSGLQNPVHTYGNPGVYSVTLTVSNPAGSDSESRHDYINVEELSGVRTVHVSPGLGTLNEAVDGDTTASGERLYINTEYMLERDGVYLMSGSIENRYPLTILAADGPGARPRLIPAVPTNGESSRPFRPRADLTLKGLYLTNEDEEGRVLYRIIRVGAEGVRVVIDDCHLDESHQSAIRLDYKDNRVLISNSLISNIGDPSSPHNGRGIDDRGNDIDSLVITNSTFYNLTSRVLRDGGGKIRYLDFNHNTVVNTGQAGLELGEVIEAHVTNNLVINPVFLGRGPGGDVSLGYAVSAKPLGSELQGVEQILNVRNNNFHLESTLVSALPDSVPAPASFCNPHAESLIESANAMPTMISEAVTFADGPASPVGIVRQWYTDPTNTSTWDKEGEPYDFQYSSSYTSYSHSTGDQPLGDLSWHDMTIASSDRTSPLEAEKSDLPSDFNSDGIVDFSDFLLFVSGFGRSVGDVGFDSSYDLNSDGSVGFQDFLLFAQRFGDRAQTGETVTFSGELSTDSRVFSDSRYYNMHGTLLTSGQVVEMELRTSHPISFEGLWDHSEGHYVSPVGRSKGSTHTILHYGRYYIVVSGDQVDVVGSYSVTVTANPGPIEVGPPAKPTLGHIEPIGD